MNISEYMDWESLFEERMDEDEDELVQATEPAPGLRAAPTPVLLTSPTPVQEPGPVLGLGAAPAPVLEEENEEDDVPSLDSLATVSAPPLVQGPGPTPGLRAASALVLGEENEEDDVPSLDSLATVSAPPLVQGPGPTPGLRAASALVLGEEDKREMNDAAKPHTPRCIICCDDVPTHIYIPCGHLCVCAPCLAHLAHHICPMCRTEAIGVYKIYNP